MAVELVEIVVQGLKGAPDLVRVPFQPGLNVLPATSRERLYARLILDQLYPRGSEPTLTDLDTPGAQSRVGLLVKGRDGAVYRLLQDANTGRRALQKVEADKAASLTNSAGEIAQAVTATLGFPTEDILRELLFCAQEDLPSQRPVAVSSSTKKAASGGPAKADKPLPPGFDGPASSPRKEDKPLPPGFSDEGAPVVDRAGRSDEQIRARIAELDELLSSQAGVKDLEFELDGLQKKVFELEGRLKPLLTLRRSVQQAEDQLAHFAGIANVPGDLVAKGEQLRKIREEHERDLQRLEDDKQSILASAKTLDESGQQKPLEVAQKDPLVKYGAAAGAGAIGVALVGGMVNPALQWLAFLDIPAFAVALFGGIRVLGTLEEGESIRRRVLRIDDAKKKLDERFKVEAEHVQSILDKHGYKLEELPDLEQQLKTRDEARDVLEKTRGALAQAQQAGDAQALEAEQAQVQARIRALEERLQSSSAGFSSTGDLLAEKEELESLLPGGSTRKAPAPAPAPEPVPEPMADPFGALDGLSGPNVLAPAAPDLALRLLELARDVLLCAIEDVPPMIQARASQILAALTDGRYREVRFSGRGDCSAVDGAAGQAIAFGTLPPFDRDVVWLSVKVALIEVVVKRDRMPVLFDRGLDFLADAKGPVLQKMLQFLGAQTQLISISEKPALGGRPG